MIKQSIVLLLCLWGAIASASFGNESAGGGDPNEMGVDEIRTDLLSWIKTGNAKGLQLPDGIAYADYVQRMSQYLAPHFVVVGFVTTAQEQQSNDPEKKVIVSGQLKSCRGFRSARDHQPHILCNSDRFPKGGKDQYRLIHHEYAGLAGVEQNIGGSSDYSVSEQITEYLMPELIYRLGIKKAALAEPQVFSLKGSELRFSAKFTSSVKVKVEWPTPDVWSKTKRGLKCECEDPGEGSYCCAVSMKASNALFVNDYRLELEDAILERKKYHMGQVVTDSELETAKKATIEKMDRGLYHVNISPKLYNALISAQMQTVYHEGDGCYTYEIRMIADSAKRTISRIWPEPVAAKCP